MGENTGRIEHEILTERAALGRSLAELEHKTRELADWRVHYRRRPELFLAGAVGAGALLGALTAGRRPEFTHLVSGAERALGSRTATRVLDTWAHVSDALLGLATAKAVDVIADFLPGFRDQYDHYDESPFRTAPPGGRG